MDQQGLCIKILRFQIPQYSAIEKNNKTIRFHSQKTN